MSTFSGLSSSPLHKKNQTVSSFFFSHQWKPPVLYVSVYSRDKGRRERKVLCQTLTHSGPVQEDFKRKFLSTFTDDIDWPTHSAVCNFYFLVFLIRWSCTYCWESWVMSLSRRCTDLPLRVGWAHVGVYADVCVAVGGWRVLARVCLCTCACMWQNVWLVCTRKLERAYLCMHVCSSVRMPLLRVCVWAFLYKSMSKQGIPTDSLSSFTTWKTKEKITRRNCWYRMTNL